MDCRVVEDAKRNLKAWTVRCGFCFVFAPKYGILVNMKKVSSQSQEESRQGYTIGRHAFAKISAVEGISLTEELRKDFQLFEQKSLSHKDRRQAITRKYAH